MDLNYVLVWVVAAFGLVLLVRAAAAKRVGWVAAAALVLGATTAAVALTPETGGYVGGAVLAVLVVLPLSLYRLAYRYTLMQEYGRARRLASVLRWLHPADGWWAWPRLLRALESGEPAAIARAADALTTRAASRTGIGRLGLALLYRVNNQWEELAAWLDEHLSPAELRRDPNMLGLALRCRGELGDLNGLLSLLGRSRRALDAPALWLVRHVCRLMAFAFCGRRDVVERLFRGTLHLYPEAVQRFWLATADIAAGRDARAELEALREETDALTAAGIGRRLSHPLPLADEVLTPDARDILAQLERDLDLDERYGPPVLAARRTAYATWALIALNLVAFVLEVVLGGSMSIATLRRLGALKPSAVAAGEWWRAVTGLFLHYGAVHLLANVLGLFVLGPFLERAVGRWRYLVIYLVSGVGSMAGIVLLWEAGLHGDHIVVGASGAIMGLVGATVVVYLHGWLRERARLAWQRLVLLVFLIGFQVVFDLATPEVSFLAHFGGVVIGFLVAILVRPRRAG